MPQCPTCGSTVTEGDAICPDCGMDLIEETHVGAPVEPVRLELLEAPSAVADGPEPPAEVPVAPAELGLAEAPADPVDEVGGAEAEQVEAAEQSIPSPPVEPEAEVAAEEETVAEVAAEEEAVPVQMPVEAASEPAGSAVSARITLRRGGTTTSEVFALGSRAVLGRFDPETGPVDVDLAQLPEAVYVSRRHAEIWQDVTGTWLIKDLGSANGTFVREADAARFRKVGDEQPVADGYEIGLGNARFEFRVMQ